MRASLPLRSAVPCTSRTEAAEPGDEYDGERFVRGTILGLLLSAVFWAWLVVALRAALG